MTRISWCLARSGQPDEWGETYDLNTWDKQSGTDLSREVATGSSCCTRYSLFNHGQIVSKVILNYQLRQAQPLLARSQLRDHC